MSKMALTSSAVEIWGNALNDREKFMLLDAIFFLNSLFILRV